MNITNVIIMHADIVSEVKSFTNATTASNVFDESVREVTPDVADDVLQASQDDGMYISPCGMDSVVITSNELVEDDNYCESIDENSKHAYIATLEIQTRIVSGGDTDEIISNAIDQLCDHPFEYLVSDNITGLKVDVGMPYPCGMLGEISE